MEMEFAKGLVGFSLFFLFGRPLFAFAAWIYCIHRQKKPRSNRCFFWDCPTKDNCPYNTLNTDCPADPAENN